MYSELSLKTEAWKKLKEDLKVLTHKYTELKKDAETNKEILRKYEKECSSLKREAQNAKDELLALQIQLNISEENNRKLKEDNSALVDRWMKKVEGEASKMNEANEFLQRYVTLPSFVFALLTLFSRIEKLRSKAKEDPLENS